MINETPAGLLAGSEAGGLANCYVLKERIVFFRLVSSLRTLGAVLSSLCLITATASAQQFVERVYTDEQGPHKYQVFVPAGYAANKPTPTILFLHGAGERGTDGKLPTLVGLGPYIQARGASFPFLAVFPQAEDTQGRLLTPWTAGSPDSERALKILNDVQKNYTVDAQRISLVGWSMGGYGAWSVGAAHPEKWSAVMILSGGGDPAKAAALKNVPVWAFHGTRDHLVPVSEGQGMAEALKSAEGKITFTEFPNGGHDIFADTFGNDGVIAWLEDPQNRPAELSKTSRPLTIKPLPFVPALNLPGAVGVRLGNDALNAMSYAAPQLIPANMLTGRLNDMFDSTSVQGRSFSVRFSGISYYGQVERVQIKAFADERVNVQLGLRNITLTVGGTSISGARQSAYAGPINIGIGHNRTVWLSLDVTPYIENRQLRLRLVNSSFSIPSDSYYVTQPAGVSVQGLGMTQERVVSGLTSGLYGARGRIENEVRAIVPNIVRQLEQQLTLTDPGPIVAGMWPLPVYQPRLQAYPQAVRTDANGISVVMGLTAAEVNPLAQPGTIETAQISGVTLDQLQGTALEVAIAPEVLEPLSKMVVDDHLARINLLDIPEKSFARLTDRAVLTEIIPDLKRLGDDVVINAEFTLLSPLDISTGAANMDGKIENTVPLKFAIPQAAVLLSVKSPTDAKWSPYARVKLDISDAVLAALQKPTHDRRVLELDWDQGVSISGTAEFAEPDMVSDKTIDVEKFVALFQESWQTWTGAGPASTTIVPDIAFAQTKLRLQKLQGLDHVLTGDFEIPTIKVTNQSDEPFIYQTKGPYSGWSESVSLEPGKSHEYPIPYPLTYRQSGGTNTAVYTLFTGTHSEYRVPLSGGKPQLFTAREP